MSDSTKTYRAIPKQPRLIWSNRDRRVAAEPVPSQTVEVIRPFHAQPRGALDLRLEDPPESRLIWTNDNLVALTSLLAGDGAHPPLEGKVDLIYIDPPFAVQSDFKINVEIEDGVSGEKLPTLIEELAYRDTWKDGLDSYLSMMRDRLELLKRLLAPTGSVYVHCDWHAGHFLKVLMDEVFGYENFRNEIVWQRTTGHSDSKTYGHVHDVILFYSSSDSWTWNKQFSECSKEYVDGFYRYKEPDGRQYTVSDLTAAGLRSGSSGKQWRGIDIAAKGKHWIYKVEKLDELDAAGKIFWPQKAGGIPPLKRYLEEMPGVNLRSIWTDVASISPHGKERTDYPTQIRRAPVRTGVVHSVSKVIGLARSGKETPDVQIETRYAKDLAKFEAFPAAYALSDPSKCVHTCCYFDSNDELRLARMLEEADDVAAWLWNDQSGVGFRIQYSYEGRMPYYYPDFLVRLTDGSLYIVESKGSIRERDRKKQDRAERYVEILSDATGDNWRYLFLINDAGVRRQDIDWWRMQGRTLFRDLARYVENAVTGAAG